MPTDVTEETFEAEVIARSAERTVLVDFWADWCQPCHALAPVIEAAVNDRGDAVVLVKVDVDANPGLCRDVLRQRDSGCQGLSRRDASWPQFTGARSRPALEVFLDDLLAPPRVDCSSRSSERQASFPTLSPHSMRGDVDAALRLIVEAVPTADAAGRERLRDVAVALFDRLGADDPLTSTYRRRLAAALY